MSLQIALDSLRLVLRMQSARKLYGSNQVAAIMYICIDRSNLQHYFLSKFKFMYNPTLYLVTTSLMVR
jgi:hypothetical protein